MLPALWPGDQLLVQRRLVSEARTGDIVVFRRDGRLFAHRVVAHEGWRLVTRGDAVPLPDPPVSDDGFLGVVVSVSRDGAPVRLAAGRRTGARLVGALVGRSSHARAMLQRLRAWHHRMRAGRSAFELGSPGRGV